MIHVSRPLSDAGLGGKYTLMFLTPLAEVGMNVSFSIKIAKFNVNS